MKNSGVAGTQSSVRRLGCWVWARNNETKQALLRLRYNMMQISRGDPLTPCGCACVSGSRAVLQGTCPSLSLV